MLRPLRIVKLVCETEESKQEREALKKAPLPPGVPEGTNRLLVSLALRYRGRGLSLAELVTAGADGWQRAQRHFGEATDKLERWGLLWVQESMLIALYADKNNEAAQL